MNYFLRYSPNHNERPAEPVSLIVMHYTGMKTGEEALEWLCNPASGVSAHYLVEEDGEIIQMVEEDRRAWHAGVSHWGACCNVNDISIGIEIVNKGHEHGYTSFPAVQMEAVLRLSQDIMERHEIPASGVVAHSDIAPSRKCDPGELFPWQWLAEQGVGLWHGMDGEEVGDIQEFDSNEQWQLRTLGYDVPEDPALHADIISAFQRRFRPARINGIWDVACSKRLTALIAKR